MSTSQNPSLLLITFVGRQKGVRDVKKSLKKNFEHAVTILPDGSETFSICEKYDTYQKGGLYPLLNICDDPKTISKFDDFDDFLPHNAMGEDMIVDQAVYRSHAHIERMGGAPPKDTVLTVAAFRSIDKRPNNDLLKNWKTWTGARAYMTDLVEAGLSCSKVSFLVRERPQLEDEDCPAFFYLLVCEVEITTPSDEGLIVDVLQRFRVERWFGYQTIYRRYD